MAAAGLGEAHEGVGLVQLRHVDLGGHRAAGRQAQHEGELGGEDRGPAGQAPSFFERARAQQTLDLLELDVDRVGAVDDGVGRCVEEWRARALERQAVVESPRSLAQALEDAGELGAQAGMTGGGLVQIVGELSEPALGHLKTEVVGCHLVDLVGLVEDDEIVDRHERDPELAEAMAQGEIGHIKVVVDHHEIGALGTSSHHGDPAALEVGTPAPDALIAGGGELAPQRRVVGE